MIDKIIDSSAESRFSNLTNLLYVSLFYYRQIAVPASVYGYENRTGSEGDEASSSLQQQRQRSFTIYEDMNHSGFVVAPPPRRKPPGQEPIYQVPSSLLTFSSSSDWRDRDVVRF